MVGIVVGGGCGGVWICFETPCAIQWDGALHWVECPLSLEANHMQKQKQMTTLTVRHSGCTAASRAAIQAASSNARARAHFEHLTAVAMPQPHRAQHERR